MKNNVSVLPVMRQLAARPGGFSNADLAKTLGLTGRCASKRAHTAATRGSIFAAKCGGVVRYFATAEDAAKAASVRKTAATRKPDPPSLHRQTAGPSRIKVPISTEPIITSRTKITIRPTPTAVARWDLCVLEDDVRWPAFSGRIGQYDPVPA